MDEILAKSLHYGHLGRAVYNSIDQSWDFSRSISPAPRISYGGVTQTTIPSPSTSAGGSSKVKLSTLSRGYPELAAGYRITRNETLSQTITTTSHTSNPQISSLLEFGRALDSDVDASGRRAVPIVAFASGECGNVISLRTIADNIVGLGDGEMAQLRVPTIEKDNAIEWSAQGAPVQQICFSNPSEERATFMVARFSSTIVFRPLYRRIPASVSTHPGSNLKAGGYTSSRIDPNFLLEISSSHTGGVAHADVKFNPWNQFQLAIVDEAGNWGVWELQNQTRRNKDNWVATSVRTGALPWDGFEGLTGLHGRHDGWSAIEWIIDDRYLVVCDRRCSILYRMDGDRIYSYSLALGFQSKSEWILDIKRSTSNSSHVFILTTSRLLWFDFSPGLISVSEGIGSSLSPRLSWRHFRDSDDITLQLSSLTVGADFYLVLFSRLNHFALTFYCSQPHKIENGPTPAPDPFIFPIPASVHKNDAESIEPDSHISSLVFKEIVPAATGEQNLDSNLSLLKAFIIDSSLRVRELLYASSSGDVNGERLRERNTLRVRHLRLAGLQKRAENPLSGFIVDDWDENAHGGAPFSDRGVSNIAPLTEPQSTLDYTQIYALATGRLDTFPQDDEGALEQNFQDSVRELVNRVTGHAFPKASTSRTALEILQRTLVLDDIDRNSHDLAMFVAQFAINPGTSGVRNHLFVQQYEFSSLRSVQQVGSMQSTELGLVDIYDRLVGYWLLDLPIDIPGRIRIIKEKSIRHFAADIVLSKMVSVRGTTVTQCTAESDENPSNSTSGLMTSDGPVPCEPMRKFITQSLHSQATTAAPQDGLALGSFVYSEIPAHRRPTFSVLSSYTTFSRAEPAARDAERILSDWVPGVDPASYSLPSGESQFLASNRASRRRSRKRMSQVMKNLSLDSSTLPPVSAPVPTLTPDWISQPDNSQTSTINLQSSQVTNNLPLTQVERGAFGGRETGKKSGVKARKKKRAAGF